MRIDVFTVQDDGRDQLLAVCLDVREARELQEWLCYTKPFGSDNKILMRADCETIAGFRTTGMEPAPVDKNHHPEVFVG